MRSVVSLALFRWRVSMQVSAAAARILMMQKIMTKEVKL